MPAFGFGWASLGCMSGSRLSSMTSLSGEGLRDVSRKNQFLPGRFAQKIFFERDVSSRDDSRIFPKIDFKVLFIKIYQLNAMDM